VLVEKFNNNAVLKLSSQKYKKVNVNCMASLGIVSNPDFFLTNIGKAGRARWLNKRPTVRGVAMNPIDHPHGGGEGKTSGGRSSVTPWGKPTKSKKKV
jgi:large subunit ribosomal protein L2